MTASDQGRANPAETEFFFDEAKYLGDADKLAAASGVRTLPQPPRPIIQEGAPPEPGAVRTFQEPDNRVIFASSPEDVQRKLFHVPDSPDKKKSCRKSLGRKS